MSPSDIRISVQILLKILTLKSIAGRKSQLLGHLEAEKQQKRKERVMLCGMIAGILLLLGVGVYTLVFKLEFNFKEYLSGMDFSHADSSLLAFYSYIATLVLLLLGLDYWLRKKKFHS